MTLITATTGPMSCVDGIGLEVVFLSEIGIRWMRSIYLTSNIFDKQIIKIQKSFYIPFLMKIHPLSPMSFTGGVEQVE